MGISQDSIPGPAINTALPAFLCASRTSNINAVVAAVTFPKMRPAAVRGQ